MRYFPVFLDLRGRLCVVVGGGSVGQRKALSLLKAGGRVAVISPEITPSLSKAAKKRKLDHI
ncbi:MAG TPA: NAD(P)-dependent oxidoreductase, partial [Thermodesulfobacteriota bacterium]|nr:NAD(P)-dependent oxidoreductase [Thermodesulfobacteriota bacterium]